MITGKKAVRSRIGGRVIYRREKLGMYKPIIDNLFSKKPNLEEILKNLSKYRESFPFKNK